MSGCLRFDRIDLRRVDEIDTPFNSVVKQAERFAFTILVAEGHGTQTDFRNEQVAGAERYFRHVASSFCIGTDHVALSGLSQGIDAFAYQSGTGIDHAGQNLHQ